MEERLTPLCGITAAILAGGLGTRLRSVLPDRQKVVAQVGGKPFLSYLLAWLEASGVGEVVLCAGYRAGDLREVVGSRHGGMKIHHSVEPSPLGTGGALRHARPFLSSDPVLVMNGDSFCPVDLPRLLSWHGERKSLATMVVVEVPDTGRYGAVELDDRGEIVAFREKGGSGRGVVNAGIYLLSRFVVDRLPDTTPLSLEQEVFPHLIGRGLHGYPVPGPFVDIGVPSDLARAAGVITSSPLFGESS